MPERLQPVRVALWSFCRAFLIVSLTGANVALIADRAWGPMFLTGCSISFVWWGNTKLSVASGRTAHLAYSLGAGCGTVTGVWIASRLC